MPNTPTALILDFGGVLTSDLWDSIRACARQDGLADNALLDLMRHDNEVHRLYIGMERGEVSQDDFEKGLANAARISPDGLLARMCANLSPDDLMLDAVADLRSRGTRIGVLSNSWGTGHFNPYDGYDLDQRADALIFSDQVKLRKPEPEIFLLMLDMLGVSGPESVFVDDIAANLAPARGLGMSAIHHLDTHETIAELRRQFTTWARSST
ncbi:HAD-IA family hydrolase [Micromonospora polyrhachis]|uniref:Epoxide hydrolase-like predicted phosphatase n=1 Tax=Micromonospora polyrhachis TaxID=1282883 RepID=A0A7W7SUH1_9ACTN|nr:HAD family phosphatase [Micromonospora polyrhachis]MBB4961169.1 epoxide hydrolase-like predicted phosphatase [Micromonospora polyrhachis]